MINPTYLFYDIETTGLNKCFDQILQFAAIRTDLAFNELARDEFSVRLNCDVIPSPGAIITHRISIAQCTQGISELDAILKIHALVNTPGTMSVGFNSLGFDDEFLRFSFYRHLLPPYTHQYAKQCGRMDLYPITTLFYLFKPDYLKWPAADGKVNLKLENINADNKLFSGRSHHAMTDVEITLALAKRFFQDQLMWNYVTDYFQKEIDEKRISESDNTLTIHHQSYRFGFLVYGKIGAVDHFIAPVIQLGPHLHYKNQILYLRLDRAALRLSTEKEIKPHAEIFRKKLAEPPIFLPYKERYLKLLSEQRQLEYQNNLTWLKEQAEIFLAIKHFYQHDKYPVIPERDVDAALYDIGFPTPPEENLFKQFHAAKPENKSIIAARFPNRMRYEQAIRMLGRHFPQYLSDSERLQFDTYLQAELIDFRGEKKLTKQNALHEIVAIKKTKVLDNEQRFLLDELENYLKSR